MRLLIPIPRAAGLAGALTVSVLAVLTTALSAVPADAQARKQPLPSRFSGSIALLNTQPLGSLATGPGVGVNLTAAWALGEARRVRLRGEFRASRYGRDTRGACLSQTVGCLIQVDIDTDYTGLYFGVGPELAFPVLGTTLVLDATAGVGTFAVSSSVGGISDLDREGLFRTNHFRNTFFAWSTGGEFRIPVSRTVAIGLGAHYQHNGVVSYVPEGGVIENPDGSIELRPLTTDANQMAFILGVAIHPSAGEGR